MASLFKVECCECGRLYYLNPADLPFNIPADLEEGEAFPSRCAYCENGWFAVLA